MRNLFHFFIFGRIIFYIIGNLRNIQAQPIFTHFKFHLKAERSESRKRSYHNLAAHVDVCYLTNMAFNPACVVSQQKLTLTPGYTWTKTPSVTNSGLLW